ncbi:MAG: hypothetical protein IIZ51_10490 [Lachnospiraceae bacterium]|nr:hypothetical protein [Lachnospiraceae bacterium]
MRACEDYPDEFVCDLAEFYGILEPDALPPLTLATLAAGLPERSRLMLALAGRKTDTRTLLMAAAVDRLSLLAWMQTKDGVKGRNRPKSIAEMLTRDEEKAQKFSVPADELLETIERIKQGTGTEEG